MDLKKIEAEMGAMPFAMLSMYYPKFKDRIIPLSMTGVTTKMFMDWRKKGLIDFPENADGREWVKLNLFEYVHLKACLKLRAFGVSLKSLKKIKEMLFKDYLEDVLINKDLIIEKMKSRQEDEQDIQKFKSWVKFLSDNYHLVPETQKIFSCNLGVLLSTLFVGNQEVCIILHDTGKEIEYKIGGYKNITEFDSLMEDSIHKPTIIIPLRNILIEFFTHDKSDFYLDQFELLNENERKILSAVQRRDFKRIEIVPLVDKKDIIVYKIEDRDLHGEVVTKLKKTLGLKNYNSILLKHRNDDQIYVETKKRL